MPIPGDQNLSLNGVTLSAQAGPLYAQVKELIKDRIESGEWPVESRVPSENELAAALEVSRLTAHRALRELAEEGLLVRIQGIGSFVAAPKTQAKLLEIKPIADQIAARGGVHESRVHLLAAEAASPEVAEAMEIEPGARVFHTIITHLENGLPLQLADRYVNPQVAEDFLDQDFTKLSPSQYLFERCRMAEAELTVESLPPEKMAQELLGIGPEESCLVVRRRTWEVGGRVSTTVRLTHPGSRYRLTGRFKPGR